MGEVGSVESALGWRYVNTVSPMQEIVKEEIFDPEDKLKPIHPVYVIPWTVVEKAHAWAQERDSK